MNRYESGVTIVVVLVVAFIFIAFFLPSALNQFTGYTVDVVLAIFGVAAVAVAVSVSIRPGRRG